MSKNVEPQLTPENSVDLLRPLQIEIKELKRIDVDEEGYSINTFISFIKIFICDCIPLIFNRITPGVLLLCIYHILSWYRIPEYNAAFGLSFSLYYFFFQMNINVNREIVQIFCAKLNGAEDYKKMRITFINAVISNFGILTVSLCIWARANVIMIGLGMREDISELAHKNMLIMAGSAVQACYNEALKAYLISLKYLKVFLVLNAFLIFTYPLVAYLFIWVLGLKIYGGAFQFVWREVVTFVVMMVYYRKKCKVHEIKFEESCSDYVKNMPSYLLKMCKIWPSVFLPYAAEDVNTVQIGQLHNNDFQAAWASVQNCFFLNIGLGSGPGSRGSVIVNNLIGEGKIKLAKRHMRYSWQATLILAFLVLMTYTIFAAGIAGFFSNCKGTQKYLIDLMFYVGISGFFDVMFNFNISMVRAVGNMHFLNLVIIINAVLSLDGLNTVSLFYWKLGPVSVMYGFILNNFVQFIYCILILHYCDWYKIKLNT